MDDLVVMDGSGDRFSLGEADDGYARLVLIEGDDVVIDGDDAVSIIDWLTERFGLKVVLPGTGSSVTLTIPGAAAGAAREIAWYGDGDAPEWLQRLATIAVGGQGDWQAQAHEDRLSIIRDVSALLTEAGQNPEAGIVTALRKALEGRSDSAKYLAALRKIHSSLHAAGYAATDEQDIPERVKVALENRDAVTAEAIREVKAAHLAELTRQANLANERARAIHIEAGRKLDAEVARERDVRARQNAALLELTGAGTVEEAFERIGTQRGRIVQLNEQCDAMAAEAAEARDEVRRAEAALHELRGGILGRRNAEGATAPGVMDTAEWLDMIERVIGPLA